MIAKLCPIRAGTPTPKRRDREATKAAFVAAAAGVFCERGYEGATTRMIAERAGYSEALIQTYFTGKEGLLLAVLRAEGGGEAELIGFFARPLCPTMETEARETLRFMTAVLARRATGLRIVLARVLADANFKEQFNTLSVRDVIREHLEERFGRYVRAGTLAASLDVVAAVELLIGQAFQLGFICPEVHKFDPAEIDRLLDGFAILLGRALEPSNPTGSRLGLERTGTTNDRES